MATINSIRKKIDEKKAEKRVLLKSQAEFQKQLAYSEKQLANAINLQVVFQNTISLMYSNVSSKLGDTVTEALNLVFPDSHYKCVVEFVERRNNVEAEIYLEDKDGSRYNPLDSVGGGIADYTCLLLRIVYIILSKYDNILVADEPLKFVDRDRVAEAALFIKQLCEDFNFKLLMVSHIPQLIEVSDTVYRVLKVKGNSVIKTN